MQLRLLFILCLYGCVAFAQKPSEAGIISDNDLYTSPVTDQYYTNGLEFFYRYLGNVRSEKVAKKIWEFRVGQYMYNPQSVRAASIDVHDRPFAGYLFAQAGINTFFKSESLLKVNMQLGVVGPESGAEKAQKFLHKMLGYHRIHGWEYQITTTPAVQLNAFYSHKIFPETYHEKTDFHLQAEGQLGTIWRSLSVEAMARVSLKGNLLPLYESSLYGGHLSGDKDFANRYELFLYFNPKVQYMNYDATIQGSPFNDKSPVTFPLIPFRFNAEAGVKYGCRRWTYAYVFNYRGKELSNNVITGFCYGSLQLGFMF